MEIWWEDIGEHPGGWVDRVDKIPPILMKSVGFLVQETQNYYVYASDLCIDGTHNGRTQVPKSVVRKFKILRQPDKAYRHVTQSIPNLSGNGSH